MQTNLFYFPDTHIDVALFELFFDPPGNAASQRPECCYIVWRRAFYSEPTGKLFHFYGAQHLPFSRGAGKAHYGEAGSLKHPSHSSLGTVGGEEGVVTTDCV